MRVRRAIWRIALFCAVINTTLIAQQARTEAAVPESELAKLDLKALMNLEITSVSRRAEPLSGAAASIFVITGDEVRRSGATNLPEALRLAPTLDVVEVNAGGYTVSARGLINSAANKLLVLIDGRSVYTPLFSGVFWDVQDVLLEDIDRIEVISGPGGTLWGVNAVNGVINIITRSAKDTHGGLVAAGAGTREEIGALRYGGKIGRDGGYRVYGKYFDLRHTETAQGIAKNDGEHKGLAGFRGDWARGTDQFMLLANVYKGSEGQPPPGTISITNVKLALGEIGLSGLNLTTLWSRSLRNGSAITVHGYFDQTKRTVPPTFGERLNIFDLQFLHSGRLAGIHSYAWGAEYRYGMDRVTNSTYVAFLPARVNQKWVALFAQDEMALPKQLRLILGARSERNDYTGYEFLPSIRLAWNVAADHMLWTAASRTVRAPSRLDRDTFAPGQPPFLLTGGPDVVSEIANVYEVGYRGQPASSLTLSVTAFHSLYDRLRTQEIAASRTSIFFANGMKGVTSGVEIWGSYQANSRWRLSGGFDGLREHLELKAGSNDSASLQQEGRDPKQSWRMRSSLDLPLHGEFDVIARRVSRRSNPAVPAYSAVDLRYGWKPRPGMELSLTGQNLLGRSHGEFTDVSTRTQIGRGVFVQFVSRFGRGL
ncbi:MAG: iron complex outerrane recepter protein [Thermoanaerobaculia bacterium]|jgi:iron complex outermembrane receptor protein|nr:iron complex outerrane recepter protein [Thermoanaerobaculia bacterium]